MTDHDLREIDASNGVELYLQDRQGDDVAERTFATYRDHLERFSRWHNASQMTSIADMDALAFKQYKMDLSGSYAPSTTQNHLGTVKRFLKWCVTIDAVDAHVVERIEIERKAYTRSGSVSADEADDILTRLRKYQYASLDHVTVALMWRIGARTGTIRAFDMDDLNLTGNDETGPYVRAVHRPETDTPLKNGEAAERPISLTESMVETIQDYLDVERPDVTDNYGREPLLATRKGRPSTSTIRATLYAVTRPCWYGRKCPAGHDPNECEAAGYKRYARDCPENNSPHDVRRGRLTHYRRNEIPKEVIGDRADVSEKVLEKHYNVMSDEEKMEQRRGYLDNL